jgi:hypothetical protein
MTGWLTRPFEFSGLFPVRGTDSSISGHCRIGGLRRCMASLGRFCESGAPALPRALPVGAPGAGITRDGLPGTRYPDRVHSVPVPVRYPVPIRYPGTWYPVRHSAVPGHAMQITSPCRGSLLPGCPRIPRWCAARFFITLGQFGDFLSVAFSFARSGLEQPATLSCRAVRRK